MQNINLISVLPSPPKKIISAKWSFPVMAGWILLLVIIYLSGWWQVAFKLRELGKIKAEKNDVDAKLVMLRTTIASAKKFNVGEQQLELTAQQYVNKLLAEQKKVSFSGFLEGLAKSTPKGLWLSRINFLDGGDRFNLSGNSLMAYLISDFVDHLKQNKVFFGQNFSAVKIAKVDTKEHKNIIVFELGAEVINQDAAQNN